MENRETYIKGFEGRYLVGALGYVRKVGREKRNYGTLNNRNDKVVHITDNNGRSRMFSMSRLVAEHFISNPDGRTQVDHIDTDRSNNRVDNLRWVWPRENAANYKTAINRKEPKLFNTRIERRPCVAKLPDGSLIFAHTLKEISDKLSCSQATASRVYHGKQPYLRGEITIRPWSPGEQSEIEF